MKLIYLPTNFSSHLRLGPLREFNDIVHWGLQKSVVGVLVGLKQQVVYKAHPKNTQDLLPFQMHYLHKQNVEIVRTPILPYVETLSEEFIIVCDYFGSGFYDCMMNGIPCVFIDFGVREFFPKALEFLKDRSGYLPASIHDQIWKDKLKKMIIEKQFNKTSK